MLTYEAVCVFGSETASCTFTVTAVTDVRTKTASITLLCTHRLCHCNREDKSEAFYFSVNMSKVTGQSKNLTSIICQTDKLCNPPTPSVVTLCRAGLSLIIPNYVLKSEPALPCRPSLCIRHPLMSASPQVVPRAPEKTTAFPRAFTRDASEHI